MIHFNSLEHCTIEQLTSAFNHAFEGYEIPLRFEVKDFERKLKVENFSAQHSIGAFNEKNELVGFILHCVSDDAAKLYNAGTGVITQYRGAKVTQKMYAYGLENGFFKGIREVVLEVLVNNKPAYKSYLNVGFKNVRTFNTYKGLLSTINAKHAVEQVALTHDLLTKFRQMATTAPSWQNDFSAMNRSKDFLEVYVVRMNSEEAGYILFNPLSKRIHQLAVAQCLRNQGIATSLISCLYKKHSFPYTIINVDSSDDAQNNWLQSVGFENVVSLYEMIWEL
jgi:ribosomal protein S18 acetylase RimI-like enzyme